MFVDVSVLITIPVGDMTSGCECVFGVLIYGGESSFSVGDRDMDWCSDFLGEGSIVSFWFYVGPGIVKSGSEYVSGFISPKVVC